MSPLNANLPSPTSSATRTAPKPKSATGAPDDGQHRGVATKVWRGLVVSSDAERLESLCEAIDQAGWRSIPCASIGEAIRQTDRWRTHLAVVDFGSMEGVQRETFRRFCQQIGGGVDGPLLVVCDEEPEPSDELWARQSGVWVYLPAPEMGEQLVGLFSEAMRVAEKLNGEGIPAVR